MRVFFCCIGTYRRFVALAPLVYFVSLFLGVFVFSVAEITQRIPMGRWANPEEVSGIVAFLCMKGAGYITSQVILVDGGWSANG